MSNELAADPDDEKRINRVAGRTVETMKLAAQGIAGGMGLSRCQARLVSRPVEVRPQGVGGFPRSGACFQCGELTRWCR